MNFQMRLLLLFRALHLSLMKQMSCSPSLSQTPTVAVPPAKKGRKSRAKKVEKELEDEEKDQSCWLYSGSNLSLFNSIFNIVVTLWSQELERKRKKKEEEEQFYKFKEREHVQQTDEVNKKK